MICLGSYFKHTLKIRIMALSVVLKVSIEIHQSCWHSKCRLSKAKFQYYVVMDPVFKTVEPKSGRDEHEGVKVAFRQ